MCGVGIAYNSKIGGVRMLDGDVTDAVEVRHFLSGFEHRLGSNSFRIKYIIRIFSFWVK